MGQPKVRGPALGIEGVRGDVSQDLEKERLLSCSPLAQLISPSRRALLDLARIERLDRAAGRR